MTPESTTELKKFFPPDAAAMDSEGYFASQAPMATNADDHALILTTEAMLAYMIICLKVGKASRGQTEHMRGFLGKVYTDSGVAKGDFTSEALVDRFTQSVLPVYEKAYGLVEVSVRTPRANAQGQTIN